MDFSNARETSREEKTSNSRLCLLHHLSFGGSPKQPAWLPETCLVRILKCTASNYIIYICHTHIYIYTWFSKQPIFVGCFSWSMSFVWVISSFRWTDPHTRLFITVKKWMICKCLFQLDDEPNHYHGKMVGNHHFHPLKIGCLEYRVEHKLLQQLQSKWHSPYILVYMDPLLT